MNKTVGMGAIACAVALAVACGEDEPLGPGSGGAAGSGATGGGGADGAAASGGSAGSGGGSGGLDASTGGGGGADASTGGGTGCPAPTSPTLLTTAAPNPEYPVVSGGNVYFSTDLAIIRVPVAGGTAVPLHTDVAPTQNEGVAVAGTDLYWADRGRGELRHLDLNNNQFSVVTNNQPGIQTVAADGTHVYWALAGGIRRRASAGGGTENLFPSQDAYAIALGEAEVFWVTLAGSVYRGLKSGGAAQLLATQTNPLGSDWVAASIALDATHVYFSLRTDVGTPSPPDAVYRVSRGNGALEPVLPISGAEGIALSPTCIYMGHRGANGRVYVRSKSLSGSPANLGGFQYPRGLAISGGSLVIADSMGTAVHRATL